MGTIKVKYALQPFYKMYFTHIYKGAQSCVRKYYFEKDKKKRRLANTKSQIQGCSLGAG